MKEYTSRQIAPILYREDTGLACATRAKFWRKGKRIGNKGYFFEPTVLTDVAKDSKLMNEEPFGPLAPILSFNDVDEAIEEANRLEYGLAAYLQTGSKERADRVSRRLRAGAVHVNGGGFNYGSPFGGYKQSGNGREGGNWGLEEYLEVKTITGWK